MAMSLEKSNKALWGDQALTPLYQSWNFGEDRSICLWATGVRKSTIKKIEKIKQTSEKYIALLANLPSGLNYWVGTRDVFNTAAGNGIK